MLPQADTLLRICERLTAVEVPYMLTGSIGCVFHGEPRATNDLDIIIDPTREQLAQLLNRLSKDYILYPETAVHAFETRSMFNLVDRHTAEKIDLIFLKDRPFSRMEFSRRQTWNLEDIPISLLSPEDAILSKLEWAKKGESERRFRDALGVALAQKDALDSDYLARWAKELDVVELLGRLEDQVRRVR